MKLELNDILQWCGTMCFIGMYTIMSFVPNSHPWNIVAGLLGSSMYFAWCVRVANKPQMIVNAVGILVCIGGLIKTFG